MFEKFRRNRVDNNYDRGDRGTAFQSGDGYDRTAVASDGTTTRTAVANRDYDGDGHTDVVDRPRTAGTHTAPAGATAAAAPGTYEETRALQRDRFGGADGTAIFFGWISAVGLAALVLAVVGAAGTRLGYATGVDTGDATSNAGTIGIVGAAILVVILLLAYYAGGYVAGRMARFDGGRQGFRVWLLGLLVTIAAALAGWIGGSQYNVYEQLNLPRIPVDEGTVATGGAITLIVVLVGTLLAAVAGGKAGDRYHARVDRLAWDRDRV